MNAPSLSSSTLSSETSSLETPSRRTRHSRKRAHFLTVPKMPLPVRALWDQASSEEKMAAHRTCSVMLQHWLGDLSKAQAALELKIPPLRVWQLSQQALAGMVAGLLKQPRGRRRGGTPMPQNREEDPRWLKAKVKELERKLKIAEDVIALLRQMPAQGKRREEKAQEKDAMPKAEAARAEPREGKRSVPERAATPSGTRKPTRPPSPGHDPGLADGAGPNPS